MVSLFEFPSRGGRADLPVDLITPGARAVSLLEFLPLSEPVDPDQEVAPAETEQDAAEDELETQRVEYLQALERAAMIDAAREQAGVEMRAQCEGEMEVRLAEEHARVSRLAEEFAQDRARYFAAAEGQVVKLALAMARRVLQHEAQTDALHLVPTVRAALARVQDGSTTSMRVPAKELEQWRGVLGSDCPVELASDEQLAPGECVLETSVGRVELGVQPQMDEIERSFDDLMQRGAV